MKYSRRNKLHMKRRKRTRVAMSQMLCRLSTVLKPGDIKFLYDDEVNHEKVFSIRTPITDTETEFRVSNQNYHAKIMPQHVLDLVEYVNQMGYVLEHARDEQPFDEDLRPTTAEEKQRFGVRIGRDNPCFPKSAYYQDIVAKEMAKATDKLRESMSSFLYGVKGDQAIIDDMKWSGIR